MAEGRSLTTREAVEACSGASMRMCCARAWR